MTTASRQPRRQFLLEWNRGGIWSLRLQNDVYDTEYITPGGTLGEVLVGLRNGGGEWRSTTTFATGDIRTVEDDGSGRRAYVFSGDGQLLHGLRGLGLVEEFSQAGDTLKWRLEFRNETEQTVEIGDIGLPLPFNKRFVQDNLANYTQVVARHSFISGHGSFLFWQRPNGIGPYLVMTPLAGTKLEYYEEIDRHQTTLRLGGLKPGRCVVRVDGEQVGNIDAVGMEWCSVDLEVGRRDVVAVEIEPA